MNLSLVICTLFHKVSIKSNEQEWLEVEDESYIYSSLEFIAESSSLIYAISVFPCDLRSSVMNMEMCILFK